MTAELDGLFTPVILGSSYGALKLALHLRIKYGVKSHIFDTHHPLLSRIAPFAECHTINYSNPDILLLDLANTASLYDGTLLCLFAMREPYVSFADARKSELEDKFVIVTRADNFDPECIR